jgi:hypothetical protein
MSPHEFQSLTFYNVNRLIDAVFHTKKVPEREEETKKTVRNFIYEALDLKYAET